MWAAFLAGLALLLVGWTRDSLQLGLLGAAAAVTLAVALLVLAAGRAPVERRLPAASYAAPLVALGATAAVVGSVFGSWLWGPGLALAVLGLVAWVREGRR